MRNTAIAMAAATALAAGGLTGPKNAEAVPVWVAPAIAGAVVGGVALGATAAHAHPYAYAPAYAYAPPPAYAYEPEYAPAYTYAPAYAYAPAPVYESRAYVAREPRVIVRQPAPRRYVRTRTHTRVYAAQPRRTVRVRTGYR